MFPVLPVKAALRAAISAAAGFGVIFYMVQHLTMAPTHVDGGLNLQFAHAISEGKRPFFEFIDIYGPINFWIPALFYSWAGQQAWAIRIWVLFVKLVSIVLGYGLVTHVSNRLYAWLTVFWLTVLLGLPWQALQEPYAFTQCLPCVLAVWYLLVVRPFSPPWLNSVLAGLLSTIVLFTKVSIGAFTIAGSMFYYLYWLPSSYQQSVARFANPVLELWFRRLQTVILAVYGAVFILFIYEHLNFLYFLYLVFPLCMLLLSGFKKVTEDRYTQQPFAHQVHAWISYDVAVLVSSMVFCGWYFGWTGTFQYIIQTTRLIYHLNYDHPFPSLGETTEYVGFNECYWTQFPLVLTGIFAMWTFFRRTSVAAQDGNADSSTAQGLFAMATFQMFAIYAYAVEVHVLGAMLPGIPVFFILLEQIEKQVKRHQVLVRCVLVTSTVVWISTLWVWPSYKALSWSEGDWSIAPALRKPPEQNRLRFLRFRSRDNPGLRDDSPNISNYDWDAAINQTAHFLDAVIEDGKRVLMLSNTQLLTYHAHAKPVGGRHQYLFYLLRNDMLTRKGFDALVPPTVLEDLLTSPPQIAVADRWEQSPLQEKIPEFNKLLEKKYILIATLAFHKIYQLKDTH